MMSTNYKPNCFEKTEAGGAFFIFHQITDELSTKHEPRLRTTRYIRNFPKLNPTHNCVYTRTVRYKLRLWLRVDCAAFA